MSLSFVASAVQTGTADGGYEETPIESREVEAANRLNQHKPLFEQLRANQEAEEAKREEMQREIMRGTCALGEDDVAHLDALEKQRLEKERKLQLRTRDEIAMFRAARAERDVLQLDDDDDDDDGDGKKEKHDETKYNSQKGQGLNDMASATTTSGNAVIKAPKIVVKKRKLKGTSNTTQVDESTSSNGKRTKTTVKKKTEQKEQTKETDHGLGGLLCGYGSSSDEE